eukprot:gene15007-21075_t
MQPSNEDGSASGDVVLNVPSTGPEEYESLNSHRPTAGASSSGPSAEDDAEEALRKDAMRKKGADFLSQALEASGKGQDPFAVAPAPQAGKAKRAARPMKEDADVAAFGKVMEEAKVYVFSAIFLVCSAASPVLIMLSFKTMQTPAVLTFLHMLGAALTLGVSNHFGVFKLELTGNTLRGSIARTMLCMFSALHHNSVNLVLVWMYVGGLLIDVGMPFLSMTGRFCIVEVMTSRFGIRLRELFDEEDCVPAPTMAFWQVDHELSVPAVKVMLMACAAYMLSTFSLLVIDKKISGDTKLMLRTAAVLGTIVLFCMEEFKTISLLAVVFTFLAVGAALASSWLKKTGSDSCQFDVNWVIVCFLVRNSTSWICTPNVVLSFSPISARYGFPGYGRYGSSVGT